MTGRLQDRVCLITGAAQGIGAAYARARAAEGASVAIVDLTRIDQAAAVEEDIAALGGRSLALEADVTDAGQMLDVGRRVVDAFGRIDCLVNNAGLMFEPEDMAGLIVFLASDESSKMTGQVLINDAGTWFSG